MPACDADSRGDPAVRRESLAIAGDRDESEFDCLIPREAPGVSVTLAASGDGEISADTSTTGRVALLVSNETDSSATVEIRASSRSEAGETSAAAGTFDVGARASLPVDLDATSLGLPRGDFEYSGMLTLAAEATFEGGVTRESAVRLSFHPVEGGWRIYDASVRDRDLSGGALSTEARAHRASAISRLRRGVRLGSVSKATTVLVSDGTDYVPPLDGIPDPDGEGGAL